jgi:succinate dehydrogenase flavin-adding protein (antitoxin of CptAB toxin-antitoxin module)
MKDPEWYATTIMRSVPFSLSLLPAALVGAYAAGTAGGVMGLGLFGKTVLGAIGGSALARPIESSFEAQGAYEEAKDKGLSDDDAEIVANQVFLDNMKLSGLDAAEFATAFLPMGKIAGNTVKRAMGKRILAATGKTSAKLGAVGAMEMMEERYQEKAVMNALGDPASLFDFDNPRLNEAGAAGAVFGVGLAGTGSVWTALRDKVTVTDDKKVKFIYDKTKKQALADGANVVEAGRIALDAVAATPEGKAHIERVVGDLVDLANGKPAKERTEAKTASDQPFIFGVNEDQNGEVTSFTMADPVSGETFEVPVLKSEDKDKMTVTPNMEAVNAKIKEIRAGDQEDAALDKLIQSDEDVDQAVERMFGEAETSQAAPRSSESAKVEPAGEAKPEAKEPWQITKDEWQKEGRPYAEAKGKIDGADIIAAVNKYGKDFDHYIAVRTAKENGLPVPKNVLKDYPDLAVKNETSQSAPVGHGVITETGTANFEEEAKPETIVERVKQINEKIGEKGSVDLEPLVNLGRSIWAEGHQNLEAFTARAKDLLSDVWDKVKDLILRAWNVVNNERGSFSTKKEYDVDEVNDLLNMAAKQDKALEISEAPSYDEIRKKAAQMAWEKINKKIDFKKRKENAALKRQGLDDARLLPAFQAINYVVEKGGFDKAKLLKDYRKETVDELSKRRIGLVKENGTVEHDVVADQLGYESGDDMINDILDWNGLNVEAEKQIKEFQYKFGDLITSGELDEFNELLMAEEEKIMNQLTAENRPKPARGLKTFIRQKTGQVKPKDKMVTEYDALAEAFRKEAQIARYAFASGKKVELEKSKEKMRWLIRRRQSLKNVRDYFNLTDAEFMSVTNRRNPALMDNYEYKRFLSDIEQKAIELAENRQAKIELLMLIESKRLKKVDNYRQAMQLPTIDKMTTDQLREFARLLEPFQDDDIFLTKRELETVDRTDLKGIKTIREALERLAKEAGVSVEELDKVKVAALDQFRFDTALRERDPFFDVLVTRMTEAKLGAELRAHNIESKVYELAKKAYKSRKRGIIARMIPQDDLIMAFLEAPADRKAAIAEQMTTEEINYAHFIQQYFSEALDYLIATKSLERGRENYFVHIRRSFLENLKDGGLKKAFSELFKTYQQDQMVFNILDDDTGNILPLEKFFQFSLQRTDTMDPTRNVTKAFLTYVRTFEKKKMFDAIIPKLDIYAQALTPTKYTPLGLEIDRSLKKFVNKWINNKKGRRISFDSVIRQGGPLDVGIRALRTFTTMLDLGLSPIVQIASFLGEQVANAENLGTRYMAIGTARMNTDKGKRIIAKYEAFVGRSLWEDFTAPGKEVTERLSDVLFSGFHVSTVLANKQFLLASLSEEEWKNEEISTERLAEMQLDMGRFRVVPGTGSLVGSTSVGDAAMQYKKWAVPIARTMIDDGEKLIRSIKEGKSLDNRTKKELIRFAYLTGAVFIVGAMAGADDTDDESYIGKFKARMYREAMTLTQGINPLLFVGVPRTWTWVKDTIKALKDLVMLEEYKTKEGLKGVGELKRQFVPGVVRSLPGVEEKE